MRLIASGVISAAEPGTPRAVAKQCHLAAYPDGEILVTYRIGAASDSEVGNAEIRRSRDGGRTWGPPETPWATSFGGRRGTIDRQVADGRAADQPGHPETDRKSVV